MIEKKNKQKEYRANQLHTSIIRITPVHPLTLIITDMISAKMIYQPIQCVNKNKTTIFNVIRKKICILQSVIFLFQIYTEYMYVCSICECEVLHPNDCHPLERSCNGKLEQKKNGEIRSTMQYLHKRKAGSLPGHKREVKSQILFRSTICSIQKVRKSGLYR